jgi:hypothetical protein
MPRKKCFNIAILTFLIMALSCPVSASTRDWQPFIVRPDLAPLKSVRQAMRLNAVGAFENVAIDGNKGNGAMRLRGEGREKKWSEFQFGIIRLRFARYQDHRSKSEAVRSNDNADGIWATMKTIPGQFGRTPYRETLETMGKIFTPHLDLGIEF